MPTKTKAVIEKELAISNSKVASLQDGNKKLIEDKKRLEGYREAEAGEVLDLKFKLEASRASVEHWKHQAKRGFFSRIFS